jgi:hypothetical protein
MTEQAPTLTRHDLEAKIVKRCWEDEAFGKEFTADPARAFVRYLQVPAADIPAIVVHQEEPGSWHIVLPSRPANMNELSEQDLERVAGGINPTWYAVVTGAAVVASLGSAVITASVSITPDKGW